MMNNAVELSKEREALDVVSFFDFQICDSTYEDILEYLLNSIEDKQKHIVFAFNPRKMVMAENDAATKEALHKADILIPDGYGIVLASRILGKPINNRITGTDLMMLLCRTISKDSSEGIYIYGATPDSLKDAVERLRKEDIHIVGGIDGYGYDYEEVVNSINRSGASILFVALGSPKQELFIAENADKLHNIRLIMGVGGSVDVISGHAKRAPLFIRKIGLEWLFRMICKPSRAKENKLLTDYIKIVMEERRRLKKAG